MVRSMRSRNCALGATYFQQVDDLGHADDVTGNSFGALFANVCGYFPLQRYFTLDGVDLNTERAQSGILQQVSLDGCRNGRIVNNRTDLVNLGENRVAGFVEGRASTTGNRLTHARDGSTSLIHLFSTLSPAATMLALVLSMALSSFCPTVWPESVYLLQPEAIRKAPRIIATIAERG